MYKRQAYDYSTAKLMDQSGINGILVGDSRGMVMLGYENTLPVTMEDMIHHTRAVTRGAKDALVAVSYTHLDVYKSQGFDCINAPST